MSNCFTEFSVWLPLHTESRVKKALRQAALIDSLRAYDDMACGTSWEDVLRRLDEPDMTVDLAFSNIDEECQKDFEQLDIHYRPLLLEAGDADGIGWGVNVAAADTPWGSEPLNTKGIILTDDAGDGYGDGAALFIQHQLLPDEMCAFSCSYRSDKHEVDAFNGSAWCVTSTGVEAKGTYNWVQACREMWKKRS